jgi:hypothetical protein
MATILNHSRSYPSLPWTTGSPNLQISLSFPLALVNLGFLEV